jgi:hypothetical protein
MGEHTSRGSPTRPLVRRSEPEPRPEFAGREVAATGEFDAETHLIATADLFNKLASNSVATMLGGNAEVDNLDPVGRQVEEDIAENLIVVNSHEQRPSGGAIFEASIGQESKPPLVGPMECKNLAELLATQPNFPDHRRWCECD